MYMYTYAISLHIYGHCKTATWANMGALTVAHIFPMGVTSNTTRVPGGSKLGFVDWS